MFRPNLNKLRSFLTHRLVFVATLPPLLYLNNKNGVAHCFLGFGTKFHKNKLDNRVQSIQYQANNPIEDRKSFANLSSINGYAALILDGHGGWQVAQYVNTHLIPTLEEKLRGNLNKKLTEKDLVVQSIQQAFDQVEGQILSIARTAYSFGLPEVSKIGACALLVVVVNNTIYTANSGDSQALLISENSGKYSFEKLNTKLNANSESQRQRLKKLFPNDKDIVVCKRQNTACYVKGRLQPTKSFGDLRLKWKDFNTLPGSQSIQSFNEGPYITHKPDIKVVELEKKHKYIIMGCDGLWDELNKLEVTEVIKKKINNDKDIPGELVIESLKKAASAKDITLAELKKIQPGARRKTHDDITIIGINLKDQFA